MDIFDLFGDDENPFEAADESNEGSSSVKACPAVRKPPNPANCGIVGLKNQGATCYMNSLIQTLRFTPGFRDKLFSLHEDQLGNLDSWPTSGPTAASPPANNDGGDSQTEEIPGSIKSSDDNHAVKNRRIPLELQLLLARLSSLDIDCIGTERLTESFGWKGRESLIQHDVQELQRVLLDAISRSLIGTKGDSLIPDLFEGTTVTLCHCKYCDNVSEREEVFQDLMLPVKGYANLDASLKEYTRMELMEKDNQYHCSKCDKKRDAMRGLKLRRLPRVLTLSLNRFEYDWERDRRVKITSKFEFPHDLTIHPYCETKPDDSDTEKSTSYTLFSVVVHSGSANGGHYKVYCRDAVGTEGIWEKPAKCKTIAKTAQQKVKSKKDSKDDSVLFGGSRRSKAGQKDRGDPVSLMHAFLKSPTGHGLTAEQIAEKLPNVWGHGWKRYKRNHGTIREFLEENFVVNNATGVVSLGSSKASTNEDSSTLNQDEDDGVHWFLCNDSSISCVTTSVIREQYNGSESAYILTYVDSAYLESMKKKLPVSAPPGIAKRVAEESLEISTMRSEYDAEINRMRITFHLGHPQVWNSSFWTFSPAPLLSQGSVTTNQNGTGISLTVDKRDGFAELYAAIHEAALSVAPTVSEVRSSLESLFELSSEICIDIAEPVNGNTDRIYVVDRVGHQNMTSIFDAGICSNSHLLIWRGGQETPLQSPKNMYPIAVKITILNYTSTAEHGVSESHHELFMPIAAKADELLHAVLHQNANPDSASAAEKRDFFMFRIAESNLIRINFDEVAVTSKSERHVQQFILADKKVSVHEWFRLRGSSGRLVPMYNEYGGGQLYATVLVTSKVSSLAELKSLAIETLEVEAKKETTLGLCVQFEDGTRHKLADSQPLSDLWQILGEKHADQNNSKVTQPHKERVTPHVVLINNDLDIDVKKGEIVIRVGFGPEARKLESDIVLHSKTATRIDSNDMNAKSAWILPISKRCTIAECLVKCLNATSISTGDWHLCSTNWHGDLDKKLNDPHATLDSCGIKSGCIVLLEYGELTPKGFLRLNIWWRDPLKVPPLNLHSTVKCELPISKSSLKTDPSISSAGHITISENATFAELLTAVSKSVPCQGGSLSLREYKNGRRGRTILPTSSPHTPLRNLRIFPGLQLCAEPAKSPPCPADSSLVRIEAVRRYPASKCTSVPCDIICEAGSLGSLRGVLCEAFDIPIDRLVVAKWERQRAQWKVLDKFSKKCKTKNSSVSGSGGVKDGDIVAVKSVDEDPQNLDDFATWEDLEDRAKEEAIAEAKRAARLSSFCSSGGARRSKKSSRPIEVGIKINLS